MSETACVSSLRMAMLAAVCAALVVCYSSAASEAEEAVRTSPWVGETSYVGSVRVVEKYPHDPLAFTQGLCVDATGRLFESDGLYGKSKVRHVDIASGRALASVTMSRTDFGEGLTAVAGGTILAQLTWRERVLHEYDLSTLRRARSVPLPAGLREGWGLAYDASRDLVYATDGSAVLRAYRRSAEGVYTRAHADVHVVDSVLGIRVEGLNELEVVGDEVWANVYPMHQGKASPCVARVDPGTGRVLGWLDLSPLLKLQSSRVAVRRHDYVLNGIAFVPPRDSETRPHLYATGKMWDAMFDIDLEPTTLGPDHVRAVCDLHLGAKT